MTIKEVIQKLIAKAQNTKGLTVKNSLKEIVESMYDGDPYLTLFTQQLDIIGKKRTLSITYLVAVDTNEGDIEIIPQKYPYGELGQIKTQTDIDNELKRLQ